MKFENELRPSTKSTTKMVPRQKWYHFSQRSKFLNKNGTISEKGQNSSTKMVPFQKNGQKWSKNGTILVRKWSKFLNKNGTISEKGQKSSLKIVTFQKMVKNPRKKWYHF